MNETATRVRLGDPEAIRRTLLIIRGKDPAPRKWKRLKMSKTTYYNVRAYLREQGHTIDD